MRQLCAALCDVTAHCAPYHLATLTRPKIMDLITRLGKWLIFPRQLSFTYSEIFTGFFVKIRVDIIVVILTHSTKQIMHLHR